MTGWTLKMDEGLLWGDSEAIKLFSMREILEVLNYFIITQIIDYSCFIWMNGPRTYVRMSIAGRQHAWVGGKYYSTHQRLKKEHLNKNDKDWFEHWIVGMTDGDGTFCIARQNGKWSLVYKIPQSRYNFRVLYYIKKQLGVGSVTKDNRKGQFLIRDRKKLETVIFPIFDKYPLLTSKNFNYLKFKQAFYILENASLTKEEKDQKLFELRDQPIPENYISPAWNASLRNSPLLPKTVNDVTNIMTKPWVIGFIEAEGSFYLVTKSPTRIVHGFGLTPKLDSIVLQGIKLTLHIPTEVKFRAKHNYYILDTTNSRAIENIIGYFHNTMKGIKSLDFKLWSKAKRRSNNGNLAKVKRIQEILFKLQRRQGRIWTNNLDQ